MIRVENVSKTFTLYDKPADRLKEVFFGHPYHTLYRALSDVSFSVDAGEVLGIIGRNGAGKSTLLKLVMGLLLPDSGSIERTGRVTGLLELGTGFNADLTGLDNIAFNGMLVGMTAREVEERTEDIVRFAELGEFINHPIKVYSTGMLMRLAFSIAIYARPTCMVIDEALSVGDAYFQQKCMREIFRFRDSGGSIVLVTHDLNAIRTLSSRALLLEDGRVTIYGDPREVADQYQARLVQDVHAGERQVVVHPSRVEVPVDAAAAQPIEHQSVLQPLISTGEVELIGARLLDSAGNACTQVLSESVIHAECDLVTSRDFDDAHFGIAIRNQYGQSVFETNTYCMDQPGVYLPAGQRTGVRFSFVCNLSHGDYAISFGVSNRGVGRAQFEEYPLLVHDVLSVRVLTNERAIVYAGVFNMHPAVEVHTARPSVDALVG